jgi:transposase
MKTCREEDAHDEHYHDRPGHYQVCFPRADVNESGKVEIRRKLRRSELIPFFEKPEACTVVMEACGAAYHWASTRGCSTLAARLD